MQIGNAFAAVCCIRLVWCQFSDGMIESFRISNYCLEIVNWQWTNKHEMDNGIPPICNELTHHMLIGDWICNICIFEWVGAKRDKKDANLDFIKMSGTYGILHINHISKGMAVAQLCCLSNPLREFVRVNENIVSKHCLQVGLWQRSLVPNTDMQLIICNIF